MVKKIFLVFFIFASIFVSAKTKVGDIYYASGKTSNKYLSKEIPAGIVIKIDTNENPLLIMSLTEGDNLKVADESAKGYLKIWETSQTDGSQNWEAVKLSDPEDTLNPEKNYPAFFWCQNCRDGGFDDWYFPSFAEITLIYRNYDVILKTLEKLCKSKFATTSNSDNKTIEKVSVFKYKWLRSSSQVSGTAISSYDVDIVGGRSAEHHNKNRTSSIRAVRKITQ